MRKAAVSPGAITKANSDLQTLANSIGRVVNGNKSTTGASAGQFVVLMSSTISGRADGLYTAAKAIPANTAIDSSYLTAAESGLNALNDKIAESHSYAYSSTGLIKTGDYISNYSFIGKSGEMKLLYLFIQRANATPDHAQYVEVATVSNDYKPTVEQATILSNPAGNYFELRFYTDGKIKIYNNSSSGKIDGTWLVPYI